MPLKRQRVFLNQRAEIADFNGGQDLGFSNLALALRHFVASGIGMVRGGIVSPGGGLFVSVSAGAGMVAADRPVIIESDTLVQCLANNSGQPRLDVVSVGYAEVPSDPQLRPFLNTATGDQTQANVNTTITSQTVVKVTPGITAASPVAPSPPSGHVGLATIRIDNGLTTITADKITQIDASRLDAMRFIQRPVDANYPLITLPFASSPQLTFAVPAGRTALLMAYVLIRPWMTDIAEAGVLHGQPATAWIHNVAQPGSSYGSDFRPVVYSSQSGTAIIPNIILYPATVLVGPVPSATYEIRVAQYGGLGGGFKSWTQCTVYDWWIAGILL